MIHTTYSISSTSLRKSASETQRSFIVSSENSMLYTRVLISGLRKTIVCAAGRLEVLSQGKNKTIMIKS